MHGSLPILNLKHVMNWLLICPPVKNVTEMNENAPILRFVSIGVFKRKMQRMHSVN